MKLLARCTMAVLGIQRLLPAQFVLDLPAMTAAMVASVKVWVVVVDLVGCSELPLVMVAFSVSFIAIVTVIAVCRCLLGHDSRSTGLELTDARKCPGCRSDVG